MMIECPSMEKYLHLNGKKVLQVILESDDKGNGNCPSEFCFMSINKEREEDFERAIFGDNLHDQE